MNVDLEDRTVVQLRVICKERGIMLGRKRKLQLIEAIEQAYENERTQLIHALDTAVAKQGTLKRKLAIAKSPNPKKSRPNANRNSGRKRKPTSVKRRKKKVSQSQTRKRRKRRTKNTNNIPVRSEAEIEAAVEAARREAALREAAIEAAIKAARSEAAPSPTPAPEAEAEIKKTESNVTVGLASTSTSTNSSVNTEAESASGDKDTPEKQADDTTIRSEVVAPTKDVNKEELTISKVLLKISQLVIAIVAVLAVLQVASKPTVNEFNVGTSMSHSAMTLTGIGKLFNNTEEFFVKWNELICSYNILSNPPILNCDRTAPLLSELLARSSNTKVCACLLGLTVKRFRSSVHLECAEVRLKESETKVTYSYERQSGSHSYAISALNKFALIMLLPCALFLSINLYNKEKYGAVILIIVTVTISITLLIPAPQAAGHFEKLATRMMESMNPPFSKLSEPLKIISEYF